MPRCPMRISHSLLQMNDFCHRRLPGGQARGGDGRRARGERSTKTVGAFFQSAHPRRARIAKRGPPRRARPGGVAESRRSPQSQRGRPGRPRLPRREAKRAPHAPRFAQGARWGAPAGRSVGGFRRFARTAEPKSRGALPERPSAQSADRQARAPAARPAEGSDDAGRAGGKAQGARRGAGGAGAQPRLRNFNNARGPRAARAQGRRKRYSPPP